VNELDACQTKRTFATEGEAWAALSSWRARYKVEGNPRPYFHRKGCKRWHIGRGRRDRNPGGRQTRGRRR